MIRLLASGCLHLLANGAGLIIATLVLPGFSIDAVSLVTVTVIFTVVEVVAGPLLISISLKNVPALTGGIALVTTLVGLLVTDTLSDGLNISGISTWVLASLIVWLCALIAGLVLPLVLFKKALDTRGGKKGR
ncbi:MAG: phage holin family protein [Thermoleophilia bacterium]|nr:phage holin family protein [Thermoleophilia bacterium]